MARRSSSAEEETDPSVAALQAQKRMLQIKRERDESIRAAVAESDAAMKELRPRIVAQREEKQKQRADRMRQKVVQMKSLADQRKALEARMVEVVEKMNDMMAELEELMGVAYEGRLSDAESAMEKLEARRELQRA